MPRISARVLLGLVRRVGELDPAGLAAPAGQHLRLDDDRRADRLGSGARLLAGVVASRPSETGMPKRAEQLLALVLVEIHRSPDSTRAPRRRRRRSVAGAHPAQTRHAQR